MDLLVDVHSWFRWVVLAALVGATALGFVRYRQGAAWSAAEARPFALAAVALDIQVLIGIVLWIANGWPARRDHPFLMLAALAVAHIAVGRARKTEGAGAYRLLGGGFALGLVLVLLGIPWEA